MEDNKKKILLEFDMKSAPVALLWTYISTANGLARWFADRVEINHKEFLFSWKNYTQEAHLLGSRIGAYMRLHWVDEPVGTFFEMRITVNELTDNTMLAVTDFAEDGEEQDVIDLWSSQIDALRRVIGC